MQYYKEESRYREDIDRGYGLSLITPLMDTRYNVNNISIVKKDRYGWRLITKDILLVLLWAYLPLIIMLGIAIPTGSLEYGTSQSATLTLFVGLTIIWAGLATFILAFLLLRSLAFYMIGMPLPEFDNDFLYRIRIQSLRGKWTTLLTTPSNVIATYAYNVINDDIRNESVK